MAHNTAVPADHDMQLPTLVDNFMLDRRIGAGAMGEVYHAVEALTGRELAIKVMSARLVGNHRAEKRFRREIAAMGVLRHSCIPAFCGYGDLPDGRPYLAMEFVAGHPLDTFVSEQRPLPEDLALWVIIQLAEVISYCHRESGMVHRDLKPGNVMVDMAGFPGLSERSRLRVIDFGLANYIDFGDFEDFSVGPRQNASQSMAGEIVGTPAYMSPEQIRGEELGFQSDIYAMGCILYHLLTGRTPYTGGSIGVVMAAHLDAPVPDPTQHAPVRRSTAAVVQRALAKSPAARFRSYQQFIANLQSARFASEQATKRVTRGAAPQPETRSVQPSTAGTEVAEHRPATARTPVQPPPPPPASSGTTGWRRPKSEPEPVSSPRGAFPAIQVPPPSAALEPIRPASDPVPSAPVGGGTPVEEYPTTPAPPTVQQGAPAGQPISTSRWRRPIRTPPPDPPPASPA
jgi:serine/threonine protein kinase